MNTHVMVYDPFFFELLAYAPQHLTSFMAEHRPRGHRHGAAIHFFSFRGSVVSLPPLLLFALLDPRKNDFAWDSSRQGKSSALTASVVARVVPALELVPSLAP